MVKFIADSAVKWIALVDNEDTRTTAIGAMSAGASAVISLEASIDTVYGAILLLEQGLHVLPSSVCRQLVNSWSDVSLPEDLSRLDDFDLKIMRRLIAGDTREEMSVRFNYSVRTINRRIRRIYNVLQVDNWREAVLKMARWNGPPLDQV